MHTLHLRGDGFTIANARATPTALDERMKDAKTSGAEAPHHFIGLRQ